MPNHLQFRNLEIGCFRQLRIPDADSFLHFRNRNRRKTLRPLHYPLAHRQRADFPMIGKKFSNGWKHRGRARKAGGGTGG